MQVALFGAGETAPGWIDQAEKLGHILAIADNDSKKWGQTIRGLPIISPSELPSLRPDRIIISATATFPIFQQLLDLGFTEDQIESPLTSPKNRRFWQSLQNAHQGQRIFIVGNGPSLNLSDLKTLHRHRELSFAFNKIFLAFDETLYRPDFYLVEDDLVAKNNQATIRQLNGFLKIYPDYLLPTLGQPDSQTGLFYFDVQDPNHFTPCFSEERYRIHSGYTCTYSAMQIALWMGCSEIVLIGLDFSFKLPANSNQDVLTNETERNHFSSQYRVPGETWNRPFLEQSRRAYLAAKSICDQRGILVYNASRSTQLDVFPAVDFDSLFLTP